MGRSLEQVRKDLASVRSTVQGGLSAHSDPLRVLTAASPGLEEVVSDLKEYRDVFPLLGDICDTVESYVHMVDQLIDQVVALKKEAEDVRLRASLPTSDSEGSELQPGVESAPIEDIPARAE